MSSDKFCLRWNDFESNISVAFRELREDKDFFDVTLACDDEQIQAHKVILSACSPFFRSILKRNPHSHPLLYLRGVKYSDLLSVLNFMYHGEVNVAQEDLNSFLAVAEDMKVKGLTQNNQTTSSKSSSQSSYTAPQHTASRHKPSPHPPEREPAPPPPKRPGRPPTFLTRDEPRAEEEVHEVDMPSQVKSEPITQAIQPLVEMGYEEEGFEEYGQEYGQDGGQGYDAGGLTVGADGNKGSDFLPRIPEDLDQFISRVELGYNCDICAAFSHVSRSNVRNHVESKHFPNTFVYNCNVCGKQCNSRQALQQHKSKICSKRHKGPKMFPEESPPTPTTPLSLPPPQQHPIGFLNN